MPDFRGKLTASEVEQVHNWMMEKSRLAKIECQTCRATDWEVVEHLVQLPIFSQAGRHADGRTYPVVAMACAHCGRFQFYSAVVVGVLSAPSPETRPVRT
jgi:hypothetical protein